MQKLSSEKPNVLALAVSQIHRSRSLEQLQDTFLRIAPRFVEASAYGFYLFDENMQTLKVKAQHAEDAFLNEYEKLRADDPLFKDLVSRKSFTHSLALFDKQEWRQQPLHDFLSQWDLDYSIEAPLVFQGKVSGTLNFAIGGKDYFAPADLSTARFLCEEFNHCYGRILETVSLKNEVGHCTPDNTRLEALGARSREVLELLLQGLSNRCMAASLGISENTVRYHVKHIYLVFDVHNRTQLAHRLYQANSKLN